MFYTYYQNNSYGSFDVSDKVAPYVIIEADSAREADFKAEDVGIYFDGFGDCPCCGNRWSRAESNWGEPDKKPSVYGKTPRQEVSRSWWGSPGDPIVIVYYKSGRKRIHRKPG